MPIYTLKSRIHLHFLSKSYFSEVTGDFPVPKFDVLYSFLIFPNFFEASEGLLTSHCQFLLFSSPTSSCLSLFFSGSFVGFFSPWSSVLVLKPMFSFLYCTSCSLTSSLQYLYIDRHIEDSEILHSNSASHLRHVSPTQKPSEASLLSKQPLNSVWVLRSSIICLQPFFILIFNFSPTWFVYSSQAGLHVTLWKHLMQCPLVSRSCYCSHMETDPSSSTSG